LKLTELKWLSASSGWREVHVNRTVDDQPIVINDKSLEGIGAHAESVIIYQLPEGYETFTSTGYVTQEAGSVVFGVLVDKGTLNIPDKANVKVSFEAIGIQGKAKVRDLWSHKDLGTFNGSFGRELSQHGAGLYRISPMH
jgi:alpha-galactosidase